VNKDDTKELARKLLAHVLSDPLAADVFREAFAALLSEDATGELVPVYDGESPEGFGGYECSYWPLAAFEKLIWECRARVAEFEIKGTNPEGATHKRRLIDVFTPTALENCARDMAVNVGFALLANLKFNIEAAIEQTFGEAMIVGEVAFAHYLTEELLKQGGVRKPKIDPRNDIEAEARKAADHRRERLLFLTKNVPYVTPPPKVGAPNKVTDARVREILRAHGNVTKERAAELLDCDPRTITNWAKGTPWKTWTRARAAILGELKTGKN
jgi:hypothetical protein